MAPMTPSIERVLERFHPAEQADVTAPQVDMQNVQVQQ